MNGLKRIFSNRDKQPTDSAPNRTPTIVNDPAEVARTRAMDKCEDCSASYNLFDCGHQYLTARNLCDRHIRVLIWEVNYNYDPEITRMAGQCRACTEHDTYEAKLKRFRDIRSQKVKHYDREVNWEAVIITEVVRMRIMSQVDFDKEIKDRTEALNEKRRIRNLDRVAAEREITMMEASINRWVPPATGSIQGQPPHGSQSFRL